MKKFIDDVRIIYKCCSLYYEDNLSQHEICEYLGISRASVSRMLKEGREQGIVKIEVTNPVKFAYGKLEKALEKKYNLKEIVVVESTSLDTTYDIVTHLSEQAASFLDQYFLDGDYIGVSMGTTLHNITKVSKNFLSERELTFVPILGGISQRKMNKIDIQSNQIAARFAQMFGGKYIQFLSPAVFSDTEILKGFLNEKSVNYIFDYFLKIKTIVMGIGIPKTQESTLISAGYISPEEMEDFIKAGVVGDIALHFYDKEGNIEPYKDFNDRIAAMSIKQIKKVKNKIAIASGTEKANAIKAAIKGGFINILITDVACAESLLGGDSDE